MRFKEFLEEIKKEKIVNNTDSGRLDRADNDVRPKPPKVTILDDGKEKVEYNVKAFPSTEKKRHWGYFIWNPETREIEEAWCDCKDFFYRLYAPYEKKDLSKWDVEKKYSKRKPFDHNREWTKITNPEGRIFGCKHMINIIKGYF
ncbi:MAG: hypothetical protein ACOC22_04285 [bacterium]